MTVYYVALAIGILAGIAGQLLLKAGADAPDFVSQLLRGPVGLGEAAGRIVGGLPGG